MEKPGDLDATVDRAQNLSQLDEQKTEKPKETAPADNTTPTSDALNDDQTYEYLSGFKLLIVMTAVTMAAFIMLLDSSIVVTAIPHITSEFHSIPDIGWYASAYLLGNCSLQPLSGKLYKHFNSKYVFLAFLAIFELGSLLCGVAVSSKMLILGRAVAGLGGSGITNGGMTIITASVKLERRPALLGFLMSVAQFGILLGPLIGGALTQYSSWRWCFYINLPAGAGVAALFLAIRIPQGMTRQRSESSLQKTLNSLDLPGAALFAPMIIMFLLALEWGGTIYAWKSKTIIGLFIGSFGNLLVFLAWEHRRGSTAMVPLSMLRKRVVYSSCLTMLLQMGNLIVLTYYISLWLQVVKGATPTLSGVYLLPMVLTQMVSAISSGLLIGRVGRYLPFSIASTIMQSIAGGLFTTFKVDTTRGYWTGVQILAGSGRGAGFQVPIIAIQNVLPADEAAIGISLIVFCQYFGGALFGTFGQTIFFNTLVHDLLKFAPKINAEAVIKAGATSVRAVVPKAMLPGVLLAYNEAIARTFYLGMAACVCATVTCLGMGWGKIKKTKKVVPVEA